MVNTPIPHNLQAEARKAAKILSEFTIPNAHVGPDKVIPAGLVESAAGLAILTVAKLGFLVTARAGSGIVIARLPGGKWSAPTAIGIAGLGGGFEAGAEVTDFVIILYSKTALDAFSHGGNLTLGGNFTIAAGPLGRNLEGDIALRSPAAIYTYSKTRGLFAGISIEGSALIERKDANKKFYGRDDIRAWHMLGGAVDPPQECSELYEVLENHRRMYEKALMAQAKKYARKGGERAVDEGAKKYGMTAVVDKLKNLKSRQTKRTTEIVTSRDGKHVEQHFEEETYTHRDPWLHTPPHPDTVQRKAKPPRPMSLPSHKLLHPEPTGERRLPSPTEVEITTKHEDSVDGDWSPDITSRKQDPVQARATFRFEGQMPCDISFVPGDVIEVLTRTDTQDDWWEGQIRDKVGIFPANYVTLL